MRMDEELLAWYRGVYANPPPLAIVPTPIHGLFNVTRAGVTISTDQAEGIALFAGISNAMYLLVCAALGATQWRALVMNEMLIVEDFVHADASACLFAPQCTKAEYALVFEHPYICSGCFDFYHCLGADREIVIVAQLLKSICSAIPDSRPLAILR